MYIGSVSSLKEQVIQKVGVMSDADLAFFVEILDRLSYKSSETPRTACKIGICRNQKLVADGYDIDKDNEEIAMLFEGCNALSSSKAEGFMFVTHDSLIPGYNEPCVMSV